MKELKEIMPLIPTPLTDEGNIDENSLKRLIDFEIENGCSGVGVLAAIGEGYLVSHDSWRKVIKITVKHMNGKEPVMVGCPSLSTLKAVELCREAEDLGADAILAFNPQGFRFYSHSELIHHYTALTDAVKIHVAPYARGEDPIAYEVISELYKKKRISYMKYAWKNCEQLEKMAKDFKNFFIFCGADTSTLRYLLLGCKGVLTATAAMLPREHVDLLAMINRGDIQGARELYAKAITTWNDIGFNNMSTWQAVHKIALKEMGIIKSAKVTMPQSMPAPHQIEEIRWFVKYYTGK